MPPELIVLLIGVILMALVLGLLIFYILRARVEREAQRKAAQKHDAIIISQKNPVAPVRFEVEGVVYESVADVQDEQHLRMILGAIRMAQTQIPPETWERLTGTAPDVPRSPVAPTSPPAPPATPSQRPSLSGVATPINTMHPDPARGLAEQVDVILQEMLMKMANPPDVSLATAHDGRMRISYEGRVYYTIEQVPDPEIQQMIRQAVALWEQRGGR
ncbi:MAG: hypothetical protein D6802_05670 [Ardenticatenia bacterium]|nr:MAG: hypothetical protein D6802_05670 [Ardenticatenia bacterium]